MTVAVGVQPRIHHIVCLSVYLSVCLTVCLSACLYACLSASFSPFCLVDTLRHNHPTVSTLPCPALLTLQRVVLGCQHSGTIIQLYLLCPALLSLQRLVLGCQQLEEAQRCGRPFNMHPQSHMLDSIGLVGVAYTHLHGSTQLN